MSKLKLPIIIVAVLAVVGGGLFMTGMVGADKGAKKLHVIEPVPLAPEGGQFIVNLADTEGNAHLLVNVALQLEPMDDAHYAAFAGGGGHGGGEAPGPGKVATYPKFFDAVQHVAWGFTSQQLRSKVGKEQFKTELLHKFTEIAEIDAAELKASAAAGDASHLGPPYHVMEIQFMKFIVED